MIDSPRFTVYRVIDPLTQATMYVGSTFNFGKRAAAHRQGCGSALKHEWTRRLRAIGLKPIVKVILSRHTQACTNQTEPFWIAHYIEAGAPLLNLDVPKVIDWRLCLFNRLEWAWIHTEHPFAEVLEMTCLHDRFDL
jgi:predicted GIY-YIG superfamily endonuclease